METLSNPLFSFEELKDFLDFKATQYENPEFITTDPIQIPKRFHRKEDIEIVAFLIATICWGSRKSIINSGNKLLNILGECPYDFIMNYQKPSNIQFVHRTFNVVDLDFFFRSLQFIYTNFIDLENCFALKENQFPKLFNRINNFRDHFMIVHHDKRSHKHIANPMSGSACKRIVMFLRWMVRSSKKGVDFGIWDTISSSELMIPLDVHTGNSARKLSLLDRKQNDWKSNQALYNNLLKYDSNDPAKYDFALFGLGAFEGF